MSWWSRRRRDLRGWPVAAAVAVVVVVVIAGAFALAPPSGSPEEPPRPIVVASGEWAPFVGPGLDGDGPVGRVVTDALRREGYDPDVSFLSWPLALSRTERGEVAAAFPFIASEERARDFLVSDPIVEFDYVLWYSTDGDRQVPRIRSADDLADLTLGCIQGYEMWPALDDAADCDATYDTSLDAFVALGAGDIDLLPEGEQPGREVLAAAPGLPDRRTFGIVDEGPDDLIAATEDLHVLLPRTEEGEVLRDRVNAGLAAVRQTETYRDAEAAVHSTPLQNVEIIPTGDDPTVRLWTGETGEEHLVAPQGTRAVVLEWPDAFAEPTVGDEPPGRVRVRVTNGPARGIVAYVDAAALRLPGDGS